jgi:hypothetical protein
LSQLLAEAFAGLLRSGAAALVVCVDDAKSIRIQNTDQVTVAAPNYSRKEEAFTVLPEQE